MSELSNEPFPERSEGYFMSTPIGHSLAGVSVYFLTRTYLLPLQWGGLRRRWKALLFCAIIACLPDIDFLPGIFAGNINYYHHKGTHSIFFAFIVSLVVCILWKKRNSLKFGFLTFILVLSHLAIDYVAIDHVAPFGIPLLWPFCERYFYFKYAFLPEVFRGASLISILNRNNIYTVVIELIIFVPIVLLSYRRAYRRVHG